MKFRRHPVLIWFLDEDLAKSALYLTNKTLVKSISGCMHVCMESNLDSRNK